MRQPLLALLAKEPGERYQSAEEMDADLRRINRGVAISPSCGSATDWNVQLMR